MSIYEPPTSPTRRGFLDWLVAVFSAITAGAMTIPGIMYLWPAARGGKAEDIEIKDAANMKPGEHTIVQLRGKTVIVRRDSSGFLAYSAVCTHLGCLVKWETARQEFLCPCHAAVFDARGRVVSGPAPAPLPEYKVKEISGKVYVGSA